MQEIRIVKQGVTSRIAFLPKPRHQFLLLKDNKMEQMAHQVLTEHLVFSKGQRLGQLWKRTGPIVGIPPYNGALTELDLDLQAEENGNIEKKKKNNKQTYLVQIIKVGKRVFDASKVHNPFNFSYVYSNLAVSYIKTYWAIGN